MPRIIAIEVWVAVNENGDHEAGCSKEEVDQRIREAHGGEGDATRVICITLTVPVPETVNLRAEIPLDANTATLAVA